MDDHATTSGSPGATRVAPQPRWCPWLQRILRAAARLRLPLTAITGLALVAGCSWTVAPPDLDRPGTPVFVTAYDKHARLALPTADGYLEYGFGDWHYYALEQWGVGSMARGAFFSRGSAFSRRRLPVIDDEEGFRRAAGGISSLRIEVDPARAAALLARLEQRWEELEGERVYREWEDLELARWDRRYHLFDNSNHKVVRWLRELDVEVRGWTLKNRFTLEGRPQR